MKQQHSWQTPFGDGMAFKGSVLASFIRRPYFSRSASSANVAKKWIPSYQAEMRGETNHADGSCYAPLTRLHARTHSFSAMLARFPTFFPYPISSSGGFYAFDLFRYPYAT